MERRARVYFHLHLVSDMTGETLNAVAKAACAQFADVEPIEHIHALVRSKRQLDRVLMDIGESPGLVLYTLMNPELRSALRDHCMRAEIPSLAVLDPVLTVMAGYLGTELLNRPGGQHELDARYFSRIDALNFAMVHDDGQSADDLEKADVVLVGVSRTSKTPTCIYLANRGYKAANVPIVPGVALPAALDTAKRPLIVGLIASPERLVQVRRNRLIALNERHETDYVDIERVREEATFARRLFESRNWPVIEVSRRSIEETAAAVINLLVERPAEAR
jgi:regulator of PEP synthase PpsR (kinase-PPPase family)